MEDQKFTRRFFDPMLNPPGMVEETLPTKTVKIFKRNLGNMGTRIDHDILEAEMGSIQFSGSHYDFGPGSYSLRITRKEVYVGSVPTDKNVECEWGLWHSRLGTIARTPFFIGTQAANRRAGDWKDVAYGGPMNPLYSMGPGTIKSVFYSKRGTCMVSASLEGIIG